MTAQIVLLVFALGMFVNEAVRARSVIAAGLACATAAFLVPLLH